MCFWLDAGLSAMLQSGMTRAVSALSEKES
jgi:hypothetical protein